MMKNLYILGAGSVGGHIALNISLYKMGYENIYFLDDDIQKIGSIYYGFKVISNIDYLFRLDENADVLIGIAFPKIKEFIIKRLQTKTNLNFPSFIAGNSWISQHVKIGRGCIIYPHSSINYGSVLEDFVVINMNTALGHHSRIGPFTSIAPGVSLGGYTKIGKCVEIGIGASTIQGISIGDYSIVGGNAMVTKSFPENSKIIGVPAILKK
jgi:sugar O-acyltransferase (sialic acid O-acetyltransferase NeuD family)